MSSYRFAGAPLSPQVFAEVAAQTLPRNETFSRNEIIEIVTAAHLKDGGKPGGGTAVATAKKALQLMSSAGTIRNVSYGYWRLDDQLTPEEVTEPVELGTGSQAVYVYYFPAYRDQAAHLGRTEWPMKIGMTTSDVPSRIKAQVGTAMPEAPTVGLIYRTDEAANAERLLHSTLRARARHLSDAPGTEWYSTSLFEVREILDFATARRHEAADSHA